MKKFLISLTLCLAILSGYAQQADNSATVFISKLSVQWGFSSLPITLVSFKGNLEGNNVVLTWQTAMELNNSHFEVLRFSSENTEPVKIAEIGSHGNSTTLINYTYTDKQALAGTSYYQLKQVDFDGKSSLSNTIAVNAGFANTAFSVYKTSYGTYSASIFSEDNKLVAISLVDMNGRVLNIINASLTKGANLVDIYTKPLVPGIYIAHLLLSDHKQMSTKILIH